MSNDTKKFKITVINLLPKNKNDSPLKEDDINAQVENVFQARTLLKIEISEHEKEEAVRKEILSENKVLLGLGAAIVSDSIRNGSHRGKTN